MDTPTNPGQTTGIGSWRPGQEKEKSTPKIRNVVSGIVFRRSGHGILIMTQTRIIQNKGYDVLGDGTQEGICETIQQFADGFESPFVALRRGFEEETGQSDGKIVKIYGADETWTTGRGDSHDNTCPFMFVAGQGVDPIWYSPIYLIEVGSDFEPDKSKADGEAGDHRWWLPESLAAAISNDPTHFFHLTARAFLKLARDPSIVDVLK